MTQRRRRAAPSSHYGRAGSSYGRRPAGKHSAAARRRRRRKRILKALAAWAVCILVMAGVAAGTVRLVRTVTTGKRTSLRQEGLEKMAQGDYSGAIASFDAALEKAGEKAVEFNTDVLCYRAEAEQRLKDYQAAAYTYRLLMDMDPDQAASYGYLEAVCLGEERAPGWQEGLLAAGGACVSSGAYERAMALYEEALGEGAENGQIYNQMGLCQMAAEDYEGARDSFDKGYELASSQTGSQAGRVPEEEEDSGEDKTEEGSAGLEDLLETGGEQARTALLKELSFNRAAVREYLGYYDEALRLFEDYVSAYGADERAQHEIDFLETRV